MAVKKSTPLTLEVFVEVLLPRIEKTVQEVVLSEVEETLGKRIDEYRAEVIGFKAEVVGELQTLRDETIIGNHQYERVLDRTERIEKHLNLPSVD